VGAVAQAERELLSERVAEGLAHAKLNGTRTGNPLGTPLRVPPDVVRRIVRMRAQGKTQQAIADALNEAGTPTAQGAPLWRQTAVRGVLARSGGDPRATGPRPRRLTA
jgi:DNA invertase Pin-like site-specific DNA recombinase